MRADSTIATRAPMKSKNAIRVFRRVSPDGTWPSKKREVLACRTVPRATSWEAAFAAKTMMHRESVKFALLLGVSVASSGCGSTTKGDATAGSGGAASPATGGTAQTASNGGTGAGAVATVMSSGGNTVIGNGGAVTGSAGNAPAAGGTTGSAGGAAAGAGGASGAVGASSGGAGASTSSGGAAGAVGDAGADARRPYKGVANSPCAARTALGVSWYYNWEQKETEPCSDGRGGEFVPMIWGHTGAEQAAASITTAVQAMATHGYANVLGFNEPDNSSQANIPVGTAIKLWPSFDVPGIHLGSPATSANSNGQSWFKDFTTQLNASSSLRADFLAIHWYGWNAGSCDAKASQLESYVKWAEGIAGNRPIWITEWGCLNQSAPDTKTVVTFYKAAVAMFARHPRLERYAWYPWATNCGLNDSNGALTELGTAYAAAPTYR